MNKSDIKKILVLLTAFQEGKSFEQCVNHKWHSCDITDPTQFLTYPEDYRVVKEKKYVPFSTAEECLEAVQKHGSWVMFKDKKLNYFNILKINKDDIVVYCASKYIFLYAEAFNDLIFSDNTPFGKLVENDNDKE